VKKYLWKYLSVFILLVIVIAVLWSLVGNSISGIETRKAKITWIIDGDTFVLESGEKVRLLGIDAPESALNSKLRTQINEGRDKDSIIALGKKAKSFCIRRYKGKTVLLLPDGVQPDRDRFGRLLRYLILEDESCINEVLLEQGLAIVYRRADFSRREDFLELEQQARRNRRGIWE
jgi:micrococcal nuclease